MVNTAFIIGGGPAGMSCALCLTEYGIRSILVDCSVCLGGAMNRNFLVNQTVLGFYKKTGIEIARKFAGHVVSRGVEVRLGFDGFSITSAENNIFEISSKLFGVEHFGAVVIATGQRERNVFDLGCGVILTGRKRVKYGGDCFAELASLRDKRIIVIGGGDNACECALRASRLGAEVSVLCRSEFRAQPKFINQLRPREDVKLISNASIENVVEYNESVVVEWFEEKRGCQTKEVDFLYVLAGYVPNTSFIKTCFSDEIANVLEMDSSGFVHVNAEHETNFPGLYSAGDVSTPYFHSVVSSIAHGAVAAKSIEKRFRKFNESKL